MQTPGTHRFPVQHEAQSGSPDILFDGLADGFVTTMREAIKQNQRRANGVKSVQPFKAGSPGNTYPFGRFAERLNYHDGLVISEELIKGTKALEWSVMCEDGTRMKAKIGSTPAMYHPGMGGICLRNAGEPGELLLGVVLPGHDMRLKYLDAADIERVELIPGEEVKFADNDARQRVVRMPEHAIVGPGIVGFR